MCHQGEAPVNSVSAGQDYKNRMLCHGYLVSVFPCITVKDLKASPGMCHAKNVGPSRVRAPEQQSGHYFSFFLSLRAFCSEQTWSL